MCHTWIVFWVLLVQFFRELLVRMCLNAQGLPYRKDFEEKRQFIIVFLEHLRRGEGLVGMDYIKQTFAIRVVFRWERWMCAHP